jgi:hypothetical protein
MKSAARLILAVLLTAAMTLEAGASLALLPTPKIWAQEIEDEELRAGDPGDGFGVGGAIDHCDCRGGYPHAEMVRSRPVSPARLKRGVVSDA